MARILIVDDEPPILLLLTLILSAEGFLIQTARDGAHAMMICATEPFDLVLSDVVMPGMDGHELAQWIAENYPATKTALMSGYDTGCWSCPSAPRKILAKPFTPSGAIGFVRGVLEPSGALATSQDSPPNSAA
jgi:two-component system, cell cycle response regulator CpdR